MALTWLCSPPLARKAAGAEVPPSRALSPLLRSRAQVVDARAAYARARWTGTLAEIKTSQGRLERWSAAHDSALRVSPLPAKLAPGQTASWIPVALDLAGAAEWTRASSILDGPLKDEPVLLPLRAHVRGRRDSPAAGLEVLGWPPDRRFEGLRPRTWDVVGRAHGGGDEAGLYVAATLSDSAGVRRAGRAARWRLLDESRPAAARSWARLSLARGLAARGESLLARVLLTRGGPRSTAETILFAELAAAVGDTVEALGPLVAIASRSDLPTSDRHACARRAAALARGATADSLEEVEWRSLARALGEVGEAAAGLRVLEARMKPPSDRGAAVERATLEAWLLFKARRYEAAATAYRALLTRRDAGARDRAEHALGLARAERGLHDFAKGDSAFALAAALDSSGTTGETAAWERAREWEDRKPPEAAAGMIQWARPRLKSPSLAAAGQVHEAIAWIRADSLGAARSSLDGPGPEDGGVWFWRANLARAAGDSVRALECYRRTWEVDPWSYEGVRAREAAGIGVDATAGTAGARRRHDARAAEPPPSSIRLLDLVGFHDLALDELRGCASVGAPARANGCIDALEERGLFRVGKGDLALDLRLRFPPAYAGSVFRAAEAESLSPCFIWSIMRKESGYNATARSRAGALGLMQLIVPTASRLARRSVSEDSLVDPGLNLRLGARYLRGLMREFGDPRAAMAAYNAGEEAVRRWVAARGTIDDLWVELIPYRETRDYVKQVYAAWRRYEAVYEAAPEP